MDLLLQGFTLSHCCGSQPDYGSDTVSGVTHATHIYSMPWAFELPVVHGVDARVTRFRE